MLISYLNIAIRNLLKHRFFTLLNLAGLSAGMAAALLILLWIKDEKGIDHFHKNIYQVMENSKAEGKIITSQNTSALLAQTLRQDMPAVTAAVVTTPENWFQRITLAHDARLSTATGIFAGPEYFNVFSYPLLSGNPADVLTTARQVVISKKIAEQLFGSTDAAIGQTFSWQLADKQYVSQVSAVFEGTPANSSIQFDVVFSFEMFRQIMNITGTMNSQNSSGPFHTYVLLQPDADLRAFDKQLSGVLSRYSNTPREMFASSYADNYLHGIFENGKAAGGRIEYLQLFALIAIFVLLIACINFMNFSTARASMRLKEIGVRKTMGATRWALAVQYLCESVLLSIAALMIATIIVWLLLPAFNNITGKHLSLYDGISNAGVFLLTALLTGLIAGSYPAVYLSGLQPVSVLKGRLVSKTGDLLVRKGLIAFQFGLSVLIIAAVGVVYQQLSYIRHKSTGIDKEHIVYFEAEGKIARNIPSYLEEIRNINGVSHAAAMVGGVIGGPGVPVSLPEQTTATPILFRNINGTEGLVETLGVRMLAGRSFSKDFSTDSTSVVVNEAAVKALGMQHPIGATLKIGKELRTIIGVTADFHFESLHEMVKPAFFHLDKQVQMVMVNIRKENTHQVLAALTKFNQAYNPGYVFSYNFLDSEYKAQYTAEERIAVISKYFAILAMLISCLGLLGLTAFTAARRKREIGIRKILGAGSANIVLLLSRDFVGALMLAMLAAVPLSYIIMNKWLLGFAYHIDLSIWFYLLPPMCMLLLAAFTFASQALRATAVNPAASLSTDV